MVSLSNVSDCLLSNALPQSAIEALERLHESYKGLLARDSLTEADQAVLMAVEITLKQIKDAQRPA